jgi:succinate-acetate transporter protein
MPSLTPQVVLRPQATPLPLGFLALMVATSSFSALQLGWIPPTQGHDVALVALVLAAPLQLVAAVFGYLGRDPVAGTGMALLAGTWAVLGLTVALSPPGTTSPALGVVLIAAGVAIVVPALAGFAKPAAALVIAVAAARFAVTGWYELTASPAARTTAGWVGIALGAVALYAALALELEGAVRRTVLPIGRSGLAREAVSGRGVFDADELAREPGVRPRL